MMNLVTVSRSTAKLQYTAVRLPFTLLDERVVARYWHDQGLFRLGFQRFLGSADELTGWLLADDDIAERGQALTRRTWHLAVADQPQRVRSHDRRGPALQAQARQPPDRQTRSG